MRRLGATLAAAAIAAFTVLPWAGAQQPGASADQRFTTQTPGAATGILTTENFPDGPDGKVKSHRATRIEYPPGTTFSLQAADNCQASAQELKAQGLSACPADSKVGDGTADIEATGAAPKAGLLKSDITVFNTSHPKDDPSLEGVMIVFHSAGQVTTVVLSEIKGNIQTEKTEPQCVPPGQPPECQFGEFSPKHVQVNVPAKSRAVGGVTYNGATTPATCPASGHWTIRHTHTYSDGTTDTFVNDLPCTAAAPRPLKAAVVPKRVKSGEPVRFRVTVTSGGTVVPGARVRFGRELMRTAPDGTAGGIFRTHRPGLHTIRVSAAGYTRTAVRYRVTR
jgi:hypothetical protein